MLSTQNPRVKLLRRLARDRRLRRADGLLVVDSPRVLATALDCGAPVDTVLTIDPDDPVVGRAAAAGASIAVVDDATLRSVAEAAHPQGVVASVRFDATPSLSLAEARLVAVIDGVGDPGNVGAIVRTAAAVGADAVVTTLGTADPTHPRAVRASAGALFAVPVLADADAVETFARLGRAGLTVVVADARGADEVPIAGRFALVVGGEVGGPGAVALDAADAVVGIPMAPAVESLNVAVTAGIMLYRLASGSAS